MKKLILIISILFSLQSFSQVDSSLRKVAVSFQARDLEFLGGFLSMPLEDFYDQAKKQFRVAVPPTGNTPVLLDTISLADLLSIEGIVRQNPDAIKANVWNRIDAVLRGLGESYLVGKLNERLLADAQTLQAIRKSGRFTLRRGND